MPFPKEGRYGTSYKKIGPSISLGMMKKLEPVLNLEKRAMHFRGHTTIKPLNAPQGPQEQATKQSKDEFCFPSSPRESKGERKKETKLTKKAAKKAKNIMKKYTNKEVLETIRNTREHIQFLRSQLQKKQNLDQQRFQ